METFESIDKRRSIRKYLDRPVEWEKVCSLLRAGQHAPSSGNLQDWRFIVITDMLMRKKVAEACYKQYWIEEAPVLIAICSDTTKTKRFYQEKGEKVYSLHNAAAAIQNMLLAATDQGLGTCWIGAFEERMLKSALKIPGNIVPQAVITVGYANEKPIQPTLYRLEDLTYLNEYGNKVANFDILMQDWSEVIRKKVLEGKAATEKTANKKGPVIAEKVKHHAKKIHSKIKEKFKKNKKE